jgi:hypothetical protein
MAELVRLRERELKAQARIDEIVTEARAASAEHQQAQERLIEFERAGGRAADRRKLEEALKAAEERTAEPWVERRRGAEQAARDAHAAVARHATEHLTELVTEIEQDAVAAAEQVNYAAEAFLRAVAARAAVESQLTGIVSLTRRMHPGDVARARSDEAAHQVRALLEQGGEAPPLLRLPVAAA